MAPTKLTLCYDYEPPVAHKYLLTIAGVLFLFQTY